MLPFVHLYLSRRYIPIYPLRRLRLESATEPNDDQQNGHHPNEAAQPAIILDLFLLAIQVAEIPSLACTPHIRPGSIRKMMTS
jgi:hypothetical protein